MTNHAPNSHPSPEPLANGQPAGDVPSRYIRELAQGFSADIIPVTLGAAAAGEAMPDDIDHDGEDLYGLINTTMIERPFCVQEIRPAERLRRDEIAAVRQNVQIHMLFTRHGSRAVEGIDPGAWVTEDYFVICRNAVDELDPDQGDVLAVEGAGHQELNGRGNISCDIGEPERAANLSELEVLRQARDIDAFAYAATFAMANSRPTFLVDACDRELAEWEAGKDPAVIHRPSLVPGRHFLTPRAGFREERAVAKIAGLALEMAQDDYYPHATRPPILKVLFGWAHARPVIAKMRRAGLRPDKVIRIK
jgi:hypothetical protein